MGKIKEYNAFISYRHTEPDSEIAIGIHKALERFRLPVNLREYFPREKWKINRVFRDQDELPIAEDLSESLTEAIQNSEYLIAVCTPRYVESKWCIREIELFKQIHDQDHILAVLADGEPAVSFPQELCYRETEFIDENGNKGTKIEKVEPIAADVRGENKADRKRKIKEESIRLAAAMYGLPYDDIKQRHREQKIKTVAAVSGICAGVFFIFGMVCMGLTIKINSQKKYIEQQQEQLQEQYREEQVKYAESMSVVSDTLLKEGRMIDAVYAARIAMPSSLEDESLPYLVSTEYALSNALGQYEQDVYVPYDTEPLDKNDDAWSYDGSYSFLDMYMSGYTIIYSYPLDEDRILVFTSDSKTYVYNNSDKTILEATTNTFSQPPSGYLTAAYINDDKLYMWFTHADYVSVYKYRKPDKNNLTGYTNSREVYARNGHMLEEGEEVLSDDGKYKLLVGPNRTIIISNAKNDKVVKRLYDLRGTIYGLDRLGNKNAYILRVSGKYSYLLNEDFDIKARIPFYYGYEDDGDTLLTYVFLSNKKDVIDGKNMEIYRQPLATYEDLIEEADDLIDGFELSEEIKDRYKMLK